MLERRDVIQRDLDTLEKWTSTNLKVSKAKYKILLVSYISSAFVHTIGKKAASNTTV